MDPSEKETSNEDICDRDRVDTTDTSMSSRSEDNVFEDDVGSSVEMECVEDNIGASGMINSGVDNVVDEHYDNEASDGSLRHQNPTQESSKERESKENTKDGERLEDESINQLIRLEDEIVVNQVRNLACRQDTCTTNTNEPVNVNLKDSPCSVQTKMTSSNELVNEELGKSRVPKSLHLSVFQKVSSENEIEKMKKMSEEFEQFFRITPMKPFPMKISVIEKGDLFSFDSTDRINTMLLVYALPFFGRVTPLPAEGRYEYFRLSTFGHAADLNLEQGVVMQLARDGFFSDINRSIVCFFCGLVITTDDQGLHHLRRTLQNHRCSRYGNVPMSMYGVESAQMLGSSSAMTPSGQPYQGLGVVQQNRLQPGTPYHSIVTSSTSFDQQNRLWPLNQVSQNNDVQESLSRSSNEINEPEGQAREGANIGASAEGVSFQDGQLASNVCEHTAERTHHQGSTSQLCARSENNRRDHYTHGRKTASQTRKQDRELLNMSQVEVDRPGDSDRHHATGNQNGTPDSVESLINSELGHNVIQMGFSRGDIIVAVRRLLNRRERVNFDSIMRELENIGAHPE